MSYWIVTDSCTDLPGSYIEKQEEFTVIPMEYYFEDKIIMTDFSQSAVHTFYQRLRAGEVAKTAQVNSETWKSAIKPLLKEGHDVLVLAFSSGLSGTCQAAMIAGHELGEKFPERKVIVLDSLCASLGEGLFAHYALQNREKGMTIDENAKWLTENTQHLNHWFTVEDLMFLYRGGRVSAVSAQVGSLLKIKPVLDVNPEGKLIPMAKVQGRKRSLRALVDKAQEYGVDLANQTVFISHGDCLEDAQLVADKLKEELGVKDIMISLIGPVIGSHAGPGTVALFFMGKDRV